MKPGVTLLDLRLMFARQPALALLFGLLVLLAIGLLTQAPPVQPGMLAANIDPARIVAAQRNFQSLLISPANLAKAQQAILDVAARHQLTVGRVEFAQEAEASTGFTRSTMHLPVSGRYADIRRFIENALASQPAMAIRHLNIQRETSGEENFALTATLTVQFMLGKP